MTTTRAALLLVATFNFALAVSCGMAQTASAGAQPTRDWSPVKGAKGSGVTVLRSATPGTLQPVFSNLTPSQTITYGTPSFFLSGTICVQPSGPCPPQGEQVTITIDNIPQTATISDNTGDFGTTFPTGTIDVGYYTITYNYPGDNNFNPATDTSTTLTVLPATPVFTNLTPSQTITYGTSSIVLSGTICAAGMSKNHLQQRGRKAPSGGGVCPPPGEQVTITIDNIPKTATISDYTGDFFTSFDTHAIPASNTPYLITYYYPGDLDFHPAIDTSTTLTVTKASSITSVIVLTPPPLQYNEPISVQAMVSGQNGGQPTGTVAFTDNATLIPGCTGVPLSNGGMALCNYSVQSSGSHIIVARYSGDNNFNVSSGQVSFMVSKADTTDVLTASPGQSQYGQPVTFTAAVAGRYGGTPTGMVDFSADGSPVPGCTGIQLAGGIAACEYSGLAGGSHIIVARYRGDSNYNGSISNPLQFLVNKADTTTTVTSSQNPSQLNQPVTFSATVTGTYGGTPTGAVSFTSDGGPIQECPLPVNLSNGMATCTTSTLTLGQHTIVAAYSGDANYNPSSGSLMQVVIAAYTVIHNFTGGLDGANPEAGLTMDRGGNLYGTTYAGGIGYGGVFRLAHKGSGWVFSPLYQFAGVPDGAGTRSRVTVASDGSLYGATIGGGTYGYGTVFNLKPQPTACQTALCFWNETQLYAFTGSSDGANPYADLTIDAAGNIYGGAYRGGSGCGVIYELTKGSPWVESVLYRFTGTGDDGCFPEGGVVFGKDGNLYGTVLAGGTYGYGAVLQLQANQQDWTENTLHSFRPDTEGGAPTAGVIFDNSGNLYSATIQYGPANGGTVFDLSSGGWNFNLLYSFGYPGSGGDDCGPQSSLVMDQSGNLYGTTLCDGQYQKGSVFKLSPSGGGSWTYTSLHDFTGGDDGSLPLSNVVFDSNGNLYGTASAGGVDGKGVVWEITP